MRSRLLLIPAALVLPGPAWASAYLTGEQAQALLFPGATFTEDFRRLDDDQVRTVREIARVPYPESTFRIWKVSTGGWFVIDQVEPAGTLVTYAVGLDASGVVTGIEVMEFLSAFDQVTDPAWRSQFKGKKVGDLFRKNEIEIASGATRSSEGITSGVRKVLTMFDLLIREPGS